MLVRGEVKPDRVAHALGVIERNALAQARLVDDLLDVSRSRVAGCASRLAETDVTAVVRDALEAIGPSADAKRISIDVQFPVGLPRITVDAGAAPAGDLEPAHERDQVHAWRGNGAR